LRLLLSIMPSSSLLVLLGLLFGPVQARRDGFGLFQVIAFEVSDVAISCFWSL